MTITDRYSPQDIIECIFTPEEGFTSAKFGWVPPAPVYGNWLCFGSGKIGKLSLRYDISGTVIIANDPANEGMELIFDYDSLEFMGLTEGEEISLDIEFARRFWLKLQYSNMINRLYYRKGGKFHLVYEYSTAKVKTPFDWGNEPNRNQYYYEFTDKKGKKKFRVLPDGKIEKVKK